MVCSMFAVDGSIKLLKIGRRMMWVLGGVCRFDCFYCMIAMLLTIIIIRETGEIFLSVCPKNKHDRQTLEKLILQHVHLGIHTSHLLQVPPPLSQLIMQGQELLLMGGRRIATYPILGIRMLGSTTLRSLIFH